MACGSAAVLDKSLVAGRVTNPVVVGQVLKQLIARTEIHETRALVAVSDSTSTFRVLQLPVGITDQDVATAVSRELPLDPERIATRWVDAGGDGTSRVVYAVAWDRAQIKSITESIKLAGLDATVVELKSASLARAVTLRSCLVVDMVSEPSEIVLVDGHLPRLWHGLELNLPRNDDIASNLANPLRSMLSFYARSRDKSFAPTSPVLIASEQVLSAQSLARLADLIQLPVQPLAAPPRVSPNVRHSNYLTCLGLIMRRN